MSLHDLIKSIYAGISTDCEAVNLLYSSMSTENIDEYDYGEKPLPYAFGRRDVRQIIVNVLLEAGAKVDVTNVFYRPLLSMPREVKYTKMLVEAHDCNPVYMSHLFSPHKLSVIFLLQNTFVLDVLIEAI